jgi:hypothetical protein
MISKGENKRAKEIQRYSVRVGEPRLKFKKYGTDHIQVVMESVLVLLLSRLKVQKPSKGPIPSTYTGLKSRYEP